MMQMDTQPDDVQIKPMEREDIPAVVTLHRRFLGYSVNSLLGPAHLAYLYEFMRSDPESIVLVARCRGDIAGVVSATLDPESLAKRLMGGLGVAGWLGLLLRLLARPGALLKWFAGRDLGRPVSYENRPVVPCLTAIAVDGRFRKAGIGKSLVTGVEDFCRNRGYGSFRLDTLADNDTSRKFYERLGFVEVEQRGENVILVRVL